MPPFAKVPNPLLGYYSKQGANVNEESEAIGAPERWSMGVLANPRRETLNLVRYPCTNSASASRQVRIAGKPVSSESRQRSGV